MRQRSHPGTFPRLLAAFTFLTLVSACGDENTTNNNSSGSSEPASGTGVMLGGNTLHFFSPSAPGTFTSSVAVNGLDAGFALEAIDYRPATGQLYGLGTNSASGGASARLYAINASNGSVAAVSGDDAFNALPAGRIGIDFNPVADRLRVVFESGSNARVNPNTVGPALTIFDVNLNPGTPAVHAIAYTNNAAGAAVTTLYGIDTSGAGAALVRIGGVNGTPSPNGGVVTAIGALGVNPDVGTDIGFDIAPSGTAYASVTVGGVSNLYSVNLGTGAAKLEGRLGPGTVTPRGLAIVP